MPNQTKTLYDRVRDRQVLLRAWRVIRANGERSGNRQTRLAIKAFDENLIANLDNIQRKLKQQQFRFDPALGVTPPKGKNKPGQKRAIVIASVKDRIVQRAILDVIGSYCTAPVVIDLLNTPTSVGGVPGRGIGHALALIESALHHGAGYVIRSDIKNFFPSFPRSNVLDYMRANVHDDAFNNLFERAITVELSNRAALGDDASLFPLGEDGVAQGSPLSVLAGNVVLREFDAKMNGRGVTCVRYIDDFLILARNRAAAEKALAAGLALLKDLGLQAYSPDDGTGKAAAGLASASYDFLGYKIVRGLNPPSDASCRKLIAKVEEEIMEGKKWISRRARLDEPDVRVRQCYLQTLTNIDSILRGWAGAFQHSQSSQSFLALDSRIDVILAAFDLWFGKTIDGRPGHVHRRAMGMRLLSDTKPTPLPALA